MIVGTVRAEEACVFDCQAGVHKHASRPFEVIWSGPENGWIWHYVRQDPARAIVWWIEDGPTQGDGFSTSSRAFADAIDTIEQEIEQQ